MKEEEHKEEDFSHLPLETQQMVARTQARTQHYQQQAEKEEKELKFQKQAHATQLASLQVELAANMLKLGVPIEEVATTTGLSTLEVLKVSNKRNRRASCPSLW